MKISELAAKPKLVELTLDDKDIVKKYGEPVQVYTYDRYPMNTYMKMTSLVDDNGVVVDMEGMVELVSDLILDENGVTIFDDEKQIPLDIAMGSITVIVGQLGN